MNERAYERKYTIESHIEWYLRISKRKIYGKSKITQPSRIPFGQLVDVPQDGGSRHGETEKVCALIMHIHALPIACSADAGISFRSFCDAVILCAVRASQCVVGVLSVLTRLLRIQKWLVWRVGDGADALHST